MAKFQDNFTTTELVQAVSQTIDFSTGNVILFSHDAPQKAFGVDGYEEFTSLSKVREYYLANTRTFSLLENLLTNPSGNVSTVDGKVFVFKTTSTNATQSSFATDTLTGNLANIIAISNGSFKIKINDGGVIYEEEFSGFDFTKFTTLQEIADYINDFIPFQLTLSTNKFVITNSVFGAGFSIVFEAGTVGTNIISDTLIKITDGVVTAGVDSNIADVKSTLPLVNSLLVNDLASVPLLTTLDLTKTHIEELATFLQANYNTVDNQKNIFLYSISTTNPLLTGMANNRNTNGNFKSFYLSAPVKDKESLHHLTTLLVAVVRSRDNFKPNNPKLVAQGLSLTTANKVQLLSRVLQVVNYNNIGLNLRNKGVTTFYNNGTPKMLSFGFYLDGSDNITLEKALFKFDFENTVDYFNAIQIFNNQNTNLSLTLADGIATAQRYSVSFLNALSENRVITPFEGNVLPFSITSGKAPIVRENELNAMKNVGFFVLPQSITDTDKQQSRLRFAFLLHTPSGVLKIESTGISFE
jgi:hypothetical protein